MPVRLLYSARSLSDVIYRRELMAIAEGSVVDISFTLTREQPVGWQGYGRRIDQELLEEVAWPPSERPLVYVCGPTTFVETAASTLVALGQTICQPLRPRCEICPAAADCPRIGVRRPRMRATSSSRAARSPRR